MWPLLRWKKWIVWHKRLLPFFNKLARRRFVDR
jgi:hypothetical protein